MQTVEALVDSNGVIKVLGDVPLPKNRRAIVTILDEEPKTTDESNSDKLYAAFRKAQEANLFSNIDDPVEWQRKLRDEWE
jgi:hypothetical protein